MIFNVNSGAGKLPVNVLPSLSGSYTYTGSAQTPTWQNFDTNQLTIGGTTSATDAGTYTVHFTPKSDYEWFDGTATPKEVTWTIDKADGSLSLSAASGTINGKGKTTTFTVTRSGNGTISVSSSNTSIATATVSGTTVTVKATGYGSATITVSVAAGTNHKAPGNKTYAVTVSYLYLYNAGNENTAVTGGWTSKGVAMGNWESGRDVGTPVLTKNSTNMEFKVQGGGASAILYAKNKIDLTNFTTLKFQGTLNTPNDSDDWNRLCVWSAVPTYWSDQKIASVSLKGSGSATKSVDVSGMTGSYVVGYGTYSGRSVVFNKVWLE